MGEVECRNDDMKMIEKIVADEFARFIETTPEFPLILDIAIAVQKELHHYYEVAPKNETSILYEDEEKLIVTSDPVWTVQWAGDWGMLSDAVILKVMHILSSAHYNYAREVLGDDIDSYRPTEVFIIVKEYV